MEWPELDLWDCFSPPGARQASGEPGSAGTEKHGQLLLQAELQPSLGCVWGQAVNL